MILLDDILGRSHTKPLVFSLSSVDKKSVQFFCYFFFNMDLLDIKLGQYYVYCYILTRKTKIQGSL